MNGLDLFSGIGGLTLALEPWVTPIVYCENDRYAQAVLLSRMSDGHLPVAPIWDDIRTLQKSHVPGVEIIYGGFPCQDISAAGTGKGMEAGSRSGLFSEILRISEEIRPSYIFLENVPAIRTRGLARVLCELTSIRYDCRWTVVSAAELGAPHLRERWFLLAANSDSVGLRNGRERNPKRKAKANSIAGNHGEKESLADAAGLGRRENGPREPLSSGQALADAEGERCGKTWELRCGESEERPSGCGEKVADSLCKGLEGRPGFEVSSSRQNQTTDGGLSAEHYADWTVEPDVGRVADGIPFRVDRLRGLGNSVVPAQAREAFERLMGNSPQRAKDE